MPSALKIIFLTAVAMTAFAANSVIARLALVDGDIGQWSYTCVRLFSGAILLMLIVGPHQSVRTGSWLSAAALLAYAGCFSLAYLTLPAGTGALILFTSVQLTMIGFGLLQGERLALHSTLGVFLAFGGLVILLNPGLHQPHILGSVVMAVSGVGWGIYSLRGRTAIHPTKETTGNFMKATVLAVALALPILWLLPESSPTPTGVWLAILSGTVTSGLGYVIWYTALNHLTAIRAGIAQLTVPAIAAAGGIMLLQEPLTSQFVFSSIIILVGVALATMWPQKNHPDLG
jgi:drug/metabolite transporter (DMT)-like permease